ncbi:MAG TPA: pentapeptide repeat-containing protein [Trichormus sp. M33_DOE_039]|nr:pentapeptide repeat-containing protein [Trichormus sp. M33_DOE_039]
MSSTQQPHYTKNIKSKRFKQECLHLDLQNTIAGQKLVVKLILLLLLLLLCFLAVMIAGYVGGLTSLNITRGTKAPWEWSAMAVVTTVVIVTAIRRQLPGILLAFVLSFCTVAVVPEILAMLGLIKFPSSAFSFSLTTLVAIAFGLGISTISFLGIRFVLALTDILFIQSQPLKLLGMPIVIVAGIVGSLGAISGELKAPNSEFRTILAMSADARMLVIVSGTLYSLCLALSGWLANYLRGTPWNYPSLQRLWAIAVGSWWGTSFVNLDLSGVNFRGAKLANTDLRARKLYRTCFQQAIGLERARVDNQYLDLEHPKVQRLLIYGSSHDRNFCGFNLQGAYLQGADMRGFDLTDTNLTGSDLKRADLRESLLVRTQLAGADFRGVDLRKNVLIDANLTEADCRGADLRGSILVRAQVARADFTGADLTGICIEDWSVSSKTCFTDVRCDYIYRKYQDEQPIDRYPVDRYFETGEFAFLYQEPEEMVELIFKGEFDFSALSLAFYKLQTEMPELDLNLKAIEQREKLWVVKVRSNSINNIEHIIEERFISVYQATHNETTVETVIKESIYRDYEETRNRLQASEQLVRQLAGITGEQAEALKELSKRAMGNSFFITGSTITNLAGSGQIEYREAADQIRSLITNSSDPSQVITILQGLINQLKGQNIATTVSTQIDLIQQIILAEAGKDQLFKKLLLEQGQQVVSAMPKDEIATAIQAVIAQLKA